MKYQIKWRMFVEIAIRVVLWLIFIWIEPKEPFIREIKKDEIWKYQYPAQDSYVPAPELWFLIIVLPATFFAVEYYLTKKVEDPKCATLGITLSYCLNGVITSYLKILVGRPRPDYFYRCFPDGKGVDYQTCTGDRRHYTDGRKSFPSGHSSFAFTCMMFMCLYIARKVNLFQENQKPQAWHLCVCLLPLLVAATIAISRTCDYHHHYEDVIAGSILGTINSYLCFKLYFSNTS